MTVASLSVQLRTRVGPRAAPVTLDLAFDVPPGISVLFGPSGSGKSLTLGCIAGLVTPHEGRIALGEDVWFDASSHTARGMHARKVGYVFQSLALFPHMTGSSNVAYGISRQLSSNERRERAVGLLTRMRVAHVADRYPSTFSGGEAQRVALARALAIEPHVLLLDEPFSALDRGLKTELIAEVREALARLPIPTIFVTHEPNDAIALGARVLFLERGRITRDVSAEHAFSETKR